MCVDVYVNEAKKEVEGGIQKNKKREWPVRLFEKPSVVDQCVQELGVRLKYLLQHVKRAVQVAAAPKSKGEQTSELFPSRPPGAGESKLRHQDYKMIHKLETDFSFVAQFSIKIVLILFCYEQKFQTHT